MIGGNISATIEKRQGVQVNTIGEREGMWIPVLTVKGFLDYISGDSHYNNFNAKVQESTHIFLCDYIDVGELSISSENSRLIIGDKKFQVQLIDDPMNIHSHIEIYLKYSGGDYHSG